MNDVISKSPIYIRWPQKVLFLGFERVRACPHYAWWRRATWRGPSGVGHQAWAIRRSVFRAPASWRGNSLGIEAWILKIRALLNSRLVAQCVYRTASWRAYL